MKRILITGSRTWEDLDVIWDAIMAEAEPFGTTVVSGNCPLGADAMAERVAREMDLGLELHPADWNRHGKRAGFLRNAEMVALGADVCLAFIRDNSKGASMTARLAQEAGIPTIIFREGE